MVDTLGITILLACSLVIGLAYLFYWWFDNWTSIYVGMLIGAAISFFFSNQLWGIAKKVVGL